jgi:hypothetical protein
MRVALLIDAYCVGKPSSRKIERATHQDVAFRVLSGDQHPDHDSIWEFRKRHLRALGALFAQGLQPCQKAGLVKLGHVAIDGTKMAANASKHKAMSDGRMGQAEKKLQEQMQRFLAEAERIDAEEDAKYGKGQRGDELPKALQRRESRLKKIREAMAALRRPVRSVTAGELEASGRARLAPEWTSGARCTSPRRTTERSEVNMTHHDGS